MCGIWMYLYGRGPQPPADAVKAAMKALEEDFGCALFRRVGPQVKPTGAAMTPTKPTGAAAGK